MFSLSNPVVAAYGTAHELEFSGRVPTLEWDVFLDPYLVKRVEIVLNEKEAFIQRQKEARDKASKAKESDRAVADYREKNDDETEASTQLQSTSYSSERLVLKYYDSEIRRRTALLVDRMLIAHGNVMQLVLEQTGYFKKYNFSRVKRTRKTLGGGIFARQWLAVYAEAMKLGLGADELFDDDDDETIDSGTTESLGTHNEPFEDEQDAADDQSEASKDPNQVSVDNPVAPPKQIYMRRSTTVEDAEDDVDDDISADGSTAESATSEPTPEKLSNRTHRDKTMRRKRKPSKTPKKKRDGVITSLNELSIVPDKPINESIQLLKQIMQCSAPFGLLLDMKSRHVSRRVWALVVDFLRDAGARVEGIGELHCLTYLHTRGFD